MNPHESQLLRRYLLGQLGPDEQAQIEQRLLVDGDFFLEVSIGEEELIDDYIGGELSELEIKAFESHFLVTEERRRQLRFGRRLATYLSEPDGEAKSESIRESGIQSANETFVNQKKERNFFSFFPALSPALSYSLAAVILFAVVGAGWLAFRDKPSPGGTLVAITLTPGLTRDGGELKRIPASINDQVRISLVLPATSASETSYNVYRTRVLADDKSEVWTSGDLVAVEESGARVVIATVPPGLLTPGDYRAVLSGRATNGSLEDVATYAFRVPR